MTIEQRNGLLRYVSDQVLAFFQKRCEHPGQMVAADILEGSVDDIEIKYCRRCGAVKTNWKPTGKSRFTTLEHTWRRPDPNLWRGS